MAQTKNAEKEILKNVLVFRDTDEITFRRPFVNKYEALLQYISTMTDDMMFTFTYSLLDEPGVRNSLWFREREYHSICQWLVYAFENEILRHFIERKEVIIYEPVAKLAEMDSFLTGKLKVKYFTVEKVKKLYKD